MEEVLLLVLLYVVPVLGQIPPPNVGHVAVIAQTEHELILEWNKVNNNNNYTYVLKYNGTETQIIALETDSVLKHTVTSLSAGTKYSFILFTEFEELRSSGYNFSSVTVPYNVENISVIYRTEFELTIKWNKVNNNSIYNYVLKYNEAETQIIAPEFDSVVKHTVSSLSAGTKYSFTLFTVFERVRSNGNNFSDVTAPSDVDAVSVIDQTEFDVTLQWNKVNNNSNYTYVLKFSNETEIQINGSESIPKVIYKVSSLCAGTKYSFTVYTEFESVRSSGYNISSLTVPSNVDSVSVMNRNDSDMILQWNIVTNRDNNIYNYSLKYGNESWEKILITNPKGDSLIIQHISGLIPATNYSFILYTIFYDVRSKGFKFTNSTTLSEVNEVRVTHRSQSHLTIEWDKLNKNSIYNYILSQSSGKEIYFSGIGQNDVIKYELSNLIQGTKYEFTVFTVVKDTKSNGYMFKSVTSIECASIDWHITNSSINAQVNGSTSVTAQNITDTLSGAVEHNRVNLQHLYPGATYNVSLLYDLESHKLLQCSQNLTLAPNSVSCLSCEKLSGGYGLAVVWNAPFGIVNVVQVDIAGKSFNQSESRQEVKGLQAAQWYTVRVTSFSATMKSPTVSVNCLTDPTGVIAGVLVFFLLVIIICAGILLWRHKLQHVGRSKQHVESKVPNNMYKPIPIEKFPEHFLNLSRDENRGFSEEYEDLSTVGIEQSRYTAELPENKSKNRFSNVLAYECSRVYLSINDEGDSDYINANYMPGFGSASRQYIASQGPLPSTINDFWRMVWERRSQAIVMVTNCIESGMAKCEQYWPLDYTTSLYGNFLVMVASEDKAQSWTLREFTVKNKYTSEVRAVRHFHFTAWPDHGVPLGTEELIRFRRLVRQHIESSPSSGPTIVHCSAGVGRTGTLIALDVLLQQLEKEKAVGISAFVQRMRLNRPLMVQTESQYVFLHQCIMDTIQGKGMSKPEEFLYENSNIIYANAVALKEYEKTV